MKADEVTMLINALSMVDPQVIEDFSLMNRDKNDKRDNWIYRQISRDPAWARAEVVKILKKESGLSKRERDILLYEFEPFIKKIYQEGKVPDET